MGTGTGNRRDSTELALNFDSAVLDDFRLVSAPVDRFVRPPAQVRLRSPLRSAATATAMQASEAAVPLPFFWYDPPWARAAVERCRLVAESAGELGLTIAALESDLTSEAGGLTDIGWPRLAPHRCDRAGWTLNDAQQATLIEVRLGMNRDAAGHYRYSAAQLARWYPDEMSDREVKDRSWLPLLFPPEWSSLLQMASKFSQLRRLGQAAIYVSCDEAYLEEVLPVVSAARGDGVIVRCQGDPTAALQQAAAIRNTNADCHRPRLWLAGGQLSAENVVKCFALGADAVAVDWICNPWLLNNEHEQLTTAERTAINLGVNVGRSPEERLRTRIQQAIERWQNEVSGLVQSLLVAAVQDLGPQHLRRVRR